MESDLKFLELLKVWIIQLPIKLYEYESKRIKWKFLLLSNRVFDKIIMLWKLLKFSKLLSATSLTISTLQTFDMSHISTPFSYRFSQYFYGVLLLKFSNMLDYIFFISCFVHATAFALSIWSLNISLSFCSTNNNWLFGIKRWSFWSGHGNRNGFCRNHCCLRQWFWLVELDLVEAFIEASKLKILLDML